LYCVIACLLMTVTDAVGQRNVANPTRMTETPVPPVETILGPLNGLTNRVSDLSKATADDPLNNLLGATRAYRIEVDNWLKRHPKDPLQLVPIWKKYLVDPVKIAVQPEYGNQIAGLFAPSALAFEDSTFKPQFQLSYELVFKDAFQWKNRLWQFVTFGVTAGTADQAFTGVTGFKNDLKAAFSIYAKLEVPLSNVWGSNRKKEDDQEAEDKAQRELYTKQLSLLDQLERAIQHIHSVLQKQGATTQGH